MIGKRIIGECLKFMQISKMPKMIMVSNYINHHQIPFCNAMYQLLGGEFAFCQTEAMEEERIKMGWNDSEKLPYLIFYQEDPAIYQEWIDTCQVVFFGGTDEESYISKRLRDKKPLVRYSERIYKEGQWKAISPRGLRRKYLDHTRYRKDKVYMLCSGAYVSSDFSIVKAYPGKLLRWGYFPETKQYDIDDLMAKKKAGNILWAARFIDWKHPELPVETAVYLRDLDVEFHMDIIGGGEYAQMVSDLVEKHNLQDKVTLCGFKTPGEVREYMERADIFLQTSDRKEGWGAVINEAMNSGCAVVADHMIGAVPFLIKHGENGLIYKDGNKQQLFELTKQLLENREDCQRIGKNACRTILGEWNAETAAERLCGLCFRLDFLKPDDVRDISADKKQILAKEVSHGPCSQAPVIAERKMYGLLTGKR